MWALFYFKVRSLTFLLFHSHPEETKLNKETRLLESDRDPLKVSTHTMTAEEGGTVFFFFFFWGGGGGGQAVHYEPNATKCNLHDW